MGCPKPLVLLLAGMLVACRTSHGEPRGAASARPSAANSAPRASVPPLRSSSPPKAPAPPPTESAALDAPREPDAFEKFYDETVATCNVDKQPDTTADVVAHELAVARCADRRIRKILARLAPDERKALTAVPETRRNEPSDWYPLWNRFVDGACYVDDALKWTRGARRPAGTMRYHMLPGCFARLTVSALHWLDSYAKKDAAGFARRVKKEAESGEKAKALQKTLAGEVGSPGTELEFAL